jgi:hypothetical protein
MNHPSQPPKKLTVGAGDSLTYQAAITATEADRKKPASDAADEKLIELNNDYNFILYGPNGFVRQFAGNFVPQPTAMVTPCLVSASYDLVNGFLNVMMTNAASSSQGKDCFFTVVDNAYKTGGPWSASLASGQSFTQNVTVTESGNWYDVSVYADFPQGTPVALRRLMGRIERPGCTTDPAMDASSRFYADARPLHVGFKTPSSHPTLDDLFAETAAAVPGVGLHKINQRYSFSSKDSEKFTNKDSRRCFGAPVDKCDVADYYGF